MRFGYWMPIFGGWLRNVRDEGMTITWPYVRDLAVDSERHGFELTLIAELNLNDIKGHHAPSLDCWTLAPAVAAVTTSLELMLAVRPNYHAPSLTAKALSTLDTIAPGRLSLNVVSSWWRDEATQYGVPFDVHDARYARTEEWLQVVRRLLSEDAVTHKGPLYQLDGTVLEPKPARPPTVYMGGESPRAKEVISGYADAYVMHGDPPEVIAGKIADLNARRAAAGRPPLIFGVSGYVICRDTEAQAQAELERILDVQSSPDAYASYQDFVAGSQLESRVSVEEYSVSNRGLRAGLIGTPAQIIRRLRAYEQAGVDLVLLQFSPQREEMARFGRDVISGYQTPRRSPGSQQRDGRD
jgi:FMNH2-dependent dimethyl sulfone monooxygenase